MTNTTYYDLNIVEGTDIVNPLTVDNPNYQKIDEVMHNNAVSGVTLATEIANATVHAINRENSDCSVIRFIATSEWKAGDSVTVDGVPVTALLPSGETLPDGAYVINANVLCILTGTNMTVFAERKKTDNANDIIYKNTNVGAELDKVNSNLNLNDGIKTLATLSSSYYAWCRKRANNVDVHIYCSFADSGTSYQDIGLTLPEGYRPAGTFFATAFDDHTNIVFTLRISADGKIQPYCKNTGSTRYMLLNVSFTV